MTDPDAGYWFAATDEEEGAGGFVWRAYLQLPGWCPGLPAWFSSEEECVRFIKEQVIGAEWRP